MIATISKTVPVVPPGDQIAARVCVLCCCARFCWHSSTGGTAFSRSVHVGILRLVTHVGADQGASSSHDRSAQARCGCSSQASTEHARCFGSPVRSRHPRSIPQTRLLPHHHRTPRALAATPTPRTAAPIPVPHAHFAEAKRYSLSVAVMRAALILCVLLAWASRTHRISGLRAANRRDFAAALIERNDSAGHYAN